MARIRNEDVIAYALENNEFVCTECASVDEKENVEQNQVLTNHDAERADEQWYCDRCGKRIF